MMLEFSSALEIVAWLPLQLSPHFLGSNPLPPTPTQKGTKGMFHTYLQFGGEKMTEPLVEEFLNSGFAMYVTFAG